MARLSIDGWLALRAAAAVALPLQAVLGVAGCALRDEDFDLDGWTLAEGDCDDLDPSRHPGAIEAVHDGVDQDCDQHDLMARATGLDHACDLEEGGALVCTGDNAYGQLEVPDRPTQWVAVAAGWYHNCALDIDGFVACWGDDQYGQVSDAPSRSGIVAIDAGANWSFAETLDRADCWGQCMDAAPRVPPGP